MWEGICKWLKLQRFCEKEKTSSLSLSYLHYITITIYVLLFGGVGVNISFDEEKSPCSSSPYKKHC